MAPVQTWLDRWVQVERNVPRGTSRYPDDNDRQSGRERTGVANAGAPLPTLAGFHHRTRQRKEFHGLSLADLSALSGASEARAAGCLTLRDDLSPGEYLSVPFVRRAWRLLWLLDDGGGVHFEFCRSSAMDDHNSPPALQAISFDWRLARSLDMDPRTAQFNLRRLLQILLATGFLDECDSHGLSCRTYELLRHGQVGPFYKALLLRLFNRYPWGFHDGLPPLAFIQYNALFITWMLTNAGDPGITAEELQESLSVLARRLALTSDDINWSEDARLVTRSLQERYLSRVARMLGLCQKSPHAALHTAQAHQATPFAGRVLQWQL